MSSFNRTSSSSNHSRPEKHSAFLRLEEVRDLRYPVGLGMQSCRRYRGSGELRNWKRYDGIEAFLRQSQVQRDVLVFCQSALLMRSSLDRLIDFAEVWPTEIMHLLLCASRGLTSDNTDYLTDRGIVIHVWLLLATFASRNFCFYVRPRLTTLL